MPDRSIAYVVSRWGEPTQTFVRREASAVQALGVEVVALSLKPVRPVAGTVPAVHLRVHQVAQGAALAVVRRPGASIRVLWTTLRWSAWGNKAPQVAAALIGLAWFGRGVLGRRPLHAHFGWVAATSAWAAAQVAGLPYTVVLHAFELHGRRYQDRFVPVPLRAASGVFVISERDRALVSARWNIDATVLHMGVPEAWLDAPPPPSADPTQLVAVGSLVPKKGHDVLLQALALCPVPYRLQIVGGGPLGPALREQAAALGLADRVELLGLLPEDDVRRRVQAAAAVVLAAREDPTGDRDGIPVALMEAMALGVPVVSTSVGAIPELVQGTGILVPPDDPEALAAALDSLSDEAVRRRCSDAGRARVRAGWTAEVGARTVERLLQGPSDG